MRGDRPLTCSNIELNSMYSLESPSTISLNSCMTGWSGLGFLSTWEIVSCRNLWWCRLSCGSQWPV